MNRWKDLNFLYKVIIGALLLAGAFIMPELMFVLDIGGLEMAFGFLVLYYKSILTWFEHKLDSIRSILNTVFDVLINSSVATPKTFSVHAVYCVLVLFGSGSLLFSMSFFCHGILIKGVY